MYLAKHLQCLYSTHIFYLQLHVNHSYLLLDHNLTLLGRQVAKISGKSLKLHHTQSLAFLSLLHTLAHKQKPNAPILATTRYNLPVSFFVSVEIKTMPKKIVNIKQYQCQFLMFTRALITACKLDIISVTSPEQANKHLVNIFWKIHFCECIFSTDIEEEKFWDKKFNHSGIKKKQ